MFIKANKLLEKREREKDGNNCISRLQIFILQNGIIKENKPKNSFLNCAKMSKHQR